MRVKLLSPRLKTGYFTASIAWALLLPATSFVASRTQAASLAYVAAMVMYGAGAILCHQLPARSFQPWGVQMPVCARCMGIYAGAAIASVVAMFSSTAGRAFQASRHRPAESLAPRGPRLALREPRLARAAAQLALLAAAAPTALTLAYEWWSGQMPSHWIRALAGVPLGAIVTAVVVASTGDQVN